MRVRHVHDGDTVFLQADGSGPVVASTAQVKVRLIGVDTPEVSPPAECYGRQAAEQVRGLLPVGSPVRVSADAGPRDRYGRRLLYVWTSAGRFVNYEIVREGWGEAIRVEPNVAYWPLLRDAGADAQRAGRGRWGSC